VTATEERRVLGSVDATVTPRIAAKQTPGCEHRALGEPVDSKRVDRVLRAARVVLARARRGEQAKRVPPRIDESDTDVPHVDGTLSSTSDTCSTSHPCPRASYGSTAPCRTTST